MLFYVIRNEKVLENIKCYDNWFVFVSLLYSLLNPPKNIQAVKKVLALKAWVKSETKGGDQEMATNILMFNSKPSQFVVVSWPPPLISLLFYTGF